jgi:hypothetical protein
MKIRIEKDCRPYYILISHEGQDLVNSLAKDWADQNIFKFRRTISDKFSNNRLPYDCTRVLLQLSLLSLFSHLCSLPYSSIYKTSPGFYYPPHKDGNSAAPVSWTINYMFDVTDDLCNTNWYSEESLNEYDSIEKPGNIVKIMNGNRVVPDCSTVFSSGCCALLNTELFHDFDNTVSTNSRSVLTLRYAKPNNVKFLDAADLILKMAMT